LSFLVCFMCYFFFFQAEDGIRDFHVTGVQVCSSDLASRGSASIGSIFLGKDSIVPPGTRRAASIRAVTFDGVTSSTLTPESTDRSEERRVGKERRPEWLTYREMQKVP